MDLIGELNSSLGITIVAALHDLNLAALYARRILLMRNGVIAAQGAPREVLTEELLRDVYGSRVRVGQHPDLAVPVVFPVPSFRTRGEKLCGESFKT